MKLGDLPLTLAARGLVRAQRLGLATPWPQDFGDPVAERQLRQAMCQAMSTPVNTSDSEARRTWEHFEQELGSLVARADLRSFLQWPIITKTMFVNQQAYIFRELLYLMNDAYWQTRWRPALQEAPVGTPPRYLLYPRSSGTLIHHVYHVCKFEQLTGIHVHNLETIFEFGGGYGSMCRVLHSLGFRGKYIIYDLPTFSALQRYYLSRLGITNVLTLTDLAQATADAWELASLFVATWSLGEAPLAARKAVEPMMRRCDAILLGYASRFGEVDNNAYFACLTQEDTGHVWMKEPIRHLPGNSYLFATRITS